jgi:ABC-type glycerol-3-phosphate transport system permease component
MDAAARGLGASTVETLLRVHAPLLARTAAASALLVFVDVMKELPATLVMRPFNFDTLATQTYTLAKDERLAEAALPSLAIVAVGVLPLLILARAVRRAQTFGCAVPPCGVRHAWHRASGESPSGAIEERCAAGVFLPSVASGAGRS